MHAPNKTFPKTVSQMQLHEETTLVSNWGPSDAAEPACLLVNPPVASKATHWKRLRSSPHFLRDLPHVGVT